ncbi:MAG: NAD(P)H-dependent oxidoreductase subunit E, partial [Candidatus Hydrogenedentota bacterium]
MTEIRFCIDDIDFIVAEVGCGKDATIPILHAIQDRFRYLPDAALKRVCEITEITPATIEGIATFFPRFRRRPMGRYTVNVCDGTACHVKGAPAVFEAFIKELGIADGEDTDKDGQFTVQRVACLGCCTLAPAVQIERVTYGHVESEKVSFLIEDFLANEANKQERPLARGDGARESAGEIRVGLGSCCIAGGSDKVRIALEDTLQTIEAPVRVKRVSCVGMCHQTPMLEVHLPDRPPCLYAKVQAEDVPEIVTRHFAPRKRSVRIRSRMGKWLEQLYSDDHRNVIEEHSI